MKKKISIAIVSFIVLAVGLYLYTAKYNISEIDADNFRTLLKENNAPIFQANLDNVIPDKFPFSQCFDALESDNFRGNGLKIVNRKSKENNHVEIFSYKTNLNYWITFENKKVTNAWIFKDGLMDPNTPNTELIRIMINKLIYNNGFTLKKSNLKRNNDIIILETEDCFIIGNFYSIDEQPYTSNILFESFSKKKYSFL